MRQTFPRFQSALILSVTIFLPLLKSSDIKGFIAVSEFNVNWQEFGRDNSTFISSHYITRMKRARSMQSLPQVERQVSNSWFSVRSSTFYIHTPFHRYCMFSHLQPVPFQCTPESFAPALAAFQRGSTGGCLQGATSPSAAELEDKPTSQVLPVCAPLPAL